MAERFKAAVLKTVERKLRGFESLSLRHDFLKTSSEFVVWSSQSLTPHPGLRTPNCSEYGEVAERLKAAAC
jgi:hypothetical protein